MNTFTLVINAGRSGSTFLEHLLRENYSDECYIAHEDIPVHVSKPRYYNRAYSDGDRKQVLSDKNILQYLNRWKTILKSKPIIETGWTAYHLSPILIDFFGSLFRYAIIHRDPVKFAFSRANMGNYHPKTFYNSAHELSPYDNRSIAPEYTDKWSRMNHYEKCMFWWFIVYREAFEFRETFTDVPNLEMKSKELFSFEGVDDLLRFLELDPDKLKKRDVPKNELPKFARESFPLMNEWRSYNKHPHILGFAEKLGYSFDNAEIEVLASKYKLPRGIDSKIRNLINYWHLKTVVAKPIEHLIRKT